MLSRSVVAVWLCCSVLQCVAVSWSVLKCVAERPEDVEPVCCCSVAVLQCVGVCCSELEGVEVCCRASRGC